MSNFTDGAPRTPLEWCDLGYYVIECNSEGVPKRKGWDKDDNKALVYFKNIKWKTSNKYYAIIHFWKLFNFNK